MIINELVTNSIKHAFPDNRRGVINIKMQMENGRYTLIVSDNGVGLAEGFHLKETSSLGLQLVSILVDQLKGESKYKTNQEPNTPFNLIDDYADAEISYLGTLKSS